MKSYKDLQVYELAHKLGLECHRLSLLLPKHELYESGSQLRRSSKSVSANIVEGYGRRRYKAEYVRFLVFAHSSCDETVEWLEYLQELYTGLHDAVHKALDLANKTGGKLNRFIEAVEEKHNVFNS